MGTGRSAGFWEVELAKLEEVLWGLGEGTVRRN